jgi:hypothetical protein
MPASPRSAQRSCAGLGTVQVICAGVPLLSRGMAGKLPHPVHGALVSLLASRKHEYRPLSRSRSTLGPRTPGPRLRAWLRQRAGRPTMSRDASRRQSAATSANSELAVAGWRGWVPGGRVRGARLGANNGRYGAIPDVAKVRYTPFMCHRAARSNSDRQSQPRSHRGSQGSNSLSFTEIVEVSGPVRLSRACEPSCALLPSLLRSPRVIAFRHVVTVASAPMGPAGVGCPIPWLSSHIH